jgi:hypothetical protein
MRYDTQNPAAVDEVGSWTFVDPTPINTERTVYGEANPNTLDEVGTWQFEETNKSVNVNLALGEELRGTIQSFGSHIQGKKLYLSFRAYNVATATFSSTDYRFAFTMTADEKLINSQVNGGQAYHSFSGFFTAGTDTIAVAFTCYSQTYWYIQHYVPKGYNYVDVNVTLTLFNNWYNTPQPAAENTWKKTAVAISPTDKKTNVWRKTAPAASAAANRVNNWGRVN